MATLGYSPAKARDIVDDVVVEYPFVQRHVGDPGPNGTANVSASNARQDSTGKWAASATVGATTTKATNASLTWANESAAEDHTHVTLWSTLSGGSFGMSGTITANPVGIGDDFVAAAGAIVLTQPNAS
jgi:hypothetical protein